MNRIHSYIVASAIQVLLESATWYFALMALPLANFSSHVLRICFADLRLSMVPFNFSSGSAKATDSTDRIQAHARPENKFAGDGDCNTRVDE